MTDKNVQSKNMVDESAREAGNATILTIDGRKYKIFLPNASTDYIQKIISIEKKPYELLMLQDIQGRLGPDDLVLDIGAHIGNHTLYLAATTDCKIVAFEPNQALAEALLYSVELNDFVSRITVHVLGLGKENSQGHFASETLDNLGAQSIELGVGDIQIVTLDSFKFDRPVSLLKIDVEGMELPVLQGGEALLRNDRPILYVECQTEEDFQRVANWLDTLNYVYWDTFNATPTHLFRPNKHVNIDHRISRLQLKSVQDTYKSKIQLTGTRSKLDATNQKYREAQEYITSLKEKLAEETTEHKAASRVVDGLQGQLIEARQALRHERNAHQAREHELNEKLHEFEREQIRLTQEALLLKQRLDAVNQKYREATSVQVPALKSTIELLRSQMQSLTEERLNIEQRLIKTRASLTYQLGYQVKNSASSLGGFVRLPLALWRIYGLALKRRKSARQKKYRTSNNTIADKATVRTFQAQAPPQPAPVFTKKSSQAKALQVRGIASPLKVACIMDEFTYGSFAPECNLHQLTPEHWRSELEAFNPEMLFIESAWRGKDKLWGSKVGHKSAELQGIVEWCCTRAIPTIFWNKEDPIHFQTFLNTAKLFDHVFTTDLDCIHRYKAALDHKRVYFLPFACQPTAHNPIELYERKDAISFAGAYYVRYPERAKDLESFLDALPDVMPVEIYDRNFGEDDPDYQFPEKYNPFIVGTLPFDKIDQAYKGYRYSINLNSIKQSQTMFARRVFELLASNTLTISNFSRGLSLMLGNLVITSDSGDQVVQRLRDMIDNPETASKIRLAALRKVMLEHTYQQRLRYICSKVKGLSKQENRLPKIAMLAKAANKAEADQFINQFLAQNHAYKHLVLLVSTNFKHLDDEQITYVTVKQSQSIMIKETIGDATWIAGMFAQDYYGPNYLLDLAIATQYSCADLIGKAAYYAAQDNEIELLEAHAAYHPVSAFPARQAALKAKNVESIILISWLDKLSDQQLESAHALAIDPYNYCRNAHSSTPKAIKERVDDLPTLDIGLSIDQLQLQAEDIAPAENIAEEKMFGPARLAELFGHCKSKNIDLAATQTALTVRSYLDDGKYEYLYAAQDLKPKSLANDLELKCYLDATPGLAISLVILFLDAQKQRINHVVFQANRNSTAEILPETAWLRLGLRMLSSGEAEIKGVVLGHRNLQIPEVLGRAEHLLLTNHYPDYSDLYRNVFVHSRVKAYAEKGVAVDVFLLRRNEPLSFDEFEGVDVLSGDAQALDMMLLSGRYKSVLVHFLDPGMWKILEKHINQTKIIVWVHGAEIQPFHRREFNYITDAERDIAKLESEKRMHFWHTVLKPLSTNLHMVFVSNIFAQEVFKDLEIDLPKDQYSIIHNPIDTEKFSYQEKSVDLRKKILSIRPFSSRKYANDIIIKVTLELSKRSIFSDLKFCIIGDGKLFEETVAPLRKFKNVTLEQRFLSHAKIAQLHKEYGLFLCPTRWDSQGVSRDEAMSSGLVPVTNAVSAIPEFVDESCGILAPAEDIQAMVRGIVELYENPDKFSILSKNAAQRVKDQTEKSKIINAELSIVTSSSN